MRFSWSYEANVHTLLYFMLDFDHYLISTIYNLIELIFFQWNKAILEYFGYILQTIIYTLWQGGKDAKAKERAGQPCLLELGDF